MAPFRDAVCFVNHDNVDASVTQVRKEFLACETLRRNEDEIAFFSFICSRFSSCPRL